jgi:hypothetical protein
MLDDLLRRNFTGFLLVNECKESFFSRFHSSSRYSFSTLSRYSLLNFMYTELRVNFVFLVHEQPLLPAIVYN